jgi:N-acetyl-anhydromuramyl-L-alanine amidase AmpD
MSSKPGVFILALTMLTASAMAIAIKAIPIVTPHRLELTRQYAREHYGIDSYELKDPQMIVVHFTETPTLKDTIDVFLPETISPARRELKDFGDVNVGVHFLVDRDGSIYSLLPTNVMGRHAIGFNYTSIGIENVAMTRKDLTTQQASADAALIEDLVHRFPSIRFLIGHHEYMNRNAPHFALFKEQVPDYRPTVKSDPDPEFMSDLRARLARVNLTLQK